MATIVKIILEAMVALVALLIISVTYTVNELDEVGGLKVVAIEAGKEVKNIAREIEEH